MNTEDAILHLKKLGYNVTPPKNTKPVTGGWRIEYAGKSGNEVRFMEGVKSEEQSIKELFESKGHEVILMEFSEDQFFFL